MANKWEEIWNKKEYLVIDKDLDEYEMFCRLKKQNGYDVAISNPDKYYRNFYNEWNDLFESIQEMVGTRVKSVYEVGCGSGVNLYLFMKHGLEVGGIDYSKSLIETAKQLGNDFTYGEALSLNTTPCYDLVMSEGVFEYFESEDYAGEVLKKMIEKSQKIVYIGGVWDEEKKDGLMNKRLKIMPDYNKRYEGLDKQFYKKSWIEKIADSYGKKVLYKDVDNPEYWNGEFLFNCFIF